MVRLRRFPVAPVYTPWEPCSSAFPSFLQDNHCHPVTWCCFFSQTPQFLSFQYPANEQGVLFTVRLHRAFRVNTHGGVLKVPDLRKSSCLLPPAWSSCPVFRAVSTLVLAARRVVLEPAREAAQPCVTCDSAPPLPGLSLGSCRQSPSVFPFCAAGILFKSKDSRYWGDCF